MKIFFGTQKIRRVGHSHILRLNNEWSLFQGDIVMLCIRRADMSDEPILCTKKISTAGGTPAVYVNRQLGYSVGEMVTFYIEKKAQKKTDNDSIKSMVDGRS